MANLLIGARKMN